jgi:hypothetical protein
MVQIRHVGMIMGQRRMGVAVGVRPRDQAFMSVLVTLIMHVRVLVLERLMGMHAAMPLPQQEHNASGHHAMSDARGTAPGPTPNRPLPVDALPDLN